MSNIVEQIVQAMEAVVATTLGPTWRELDYKFDISLNSFRGNDKRYGILPSDASPGPSLLKAYTLEQDFRLTLTHNYEDKSSDQGLRSRMYLLYDKSSEIFKALLLTKANLPNTIMAISSVSIDAPNRVDEENVIALTSSFKVLYREALN